MIQVEEGIESQTCSCTLHTNFVSNHSYSVIGDFLALQLLISFCTMLPPWPCLVVGCIILHHALVDVIKSVLTEPKITGLTNNKPISITRLSPSKHQMDDKGKLAWPRFHVNTVGQLIHPMRRGRRPCLNIRGLWWKMRTWVGHLYASTTRYFLGRQERKRGGGRCCGGASRPSDPFRWRWIPVVEK